MERYTLNDLERLTGIKADTLRMWEQRYRITAPHRTATKRKWYTGDDLRKLINISILNRNGVKISEISAMPLKALEDKAADLTKGNGRTNDLIASLIIAMTNYDEAAVNEILLRSVISNGFQETFSSVVFPFLRKVGVMWHTGTVNVGAEHFISNIFRRRLIAAFDNLPPVISGKSKRVLLFLPENEYHELGLLYYALIVRSLGHAVLYLGQSTPTNAVTEVSETWQPDIIITGALSGMPVSDGDDFIMELIHAFPGKILLFSGILAEIAGRKELPGVFACRAENDLKLFL